MVNMFPVTIRPPFEARANAVMPRLISPASLTPTGVNSIPNDEATDWIAPNWPIPEVVAASRSTATRVTPGAVFEQFHPFPADRIFGEGKTGGVASGPR